MSSCKVFLSIMDKVNKKAVVKEINERRGLVRGKLGHRVGKQLRITPDLFFYLDDSLDYSEKIDELLN